MPSKNRRRFRLGLDVGGVYIQFPRAFKKLAQFVIDAGGEVFLISYNNPPVTCEALAKGCWRGFIYTKGVVNAGTWEPSTWKAGVCRALKIDLFIDDNPSNVEAIRRAGIEAIRIDPNAI